MGAESYLEAKGLQMSASLQDKLRVTASNIKEIRPPKTQPLCNIYTAKAGEEAPASPNKVTVQQWLQRAAEIIPELDDLITKVCKAKKCRKMMRKGTKKEARILQKAKNDYGGEINQVIDMVGGTVIVPSRGNYREVVRRIQQQVRKQRLQIVKLKKLGFEDEGPGYHDIKISVRFSNGIIGEIIVVSEFINKAKFDRGGHLVYEVKRNLEPLVESHKQVRKAIIALNELSATIYNASADSDALESSKSKAAEELTALRELLQNVSSSEEVNGVVKSFDSLLNLIKPASVSSTAAFISSQTQNISKDDISQESGDVNKKNKKISASEQDEEIKAIREAAIANNTFMKVPNGKPTKLTERQWLQVRTRAFKDWFGDWETVAKFRSVRDAIMSMPIVASLSGKEFQRDGVKLTDKVTAYWREEFGGKATSPELGDVSLDIQGVKSSLGHGIGALKAAAFYAVPKVVQNGKVFNRSANWKNRGYDTAALAAPISIAGKEYICEIVVEQRPNRQGFYLHEVEVKEKLGNVFKTSTEGGTRQASRSILARWNDKVNTIFENCSKAQGG